MLVTSFKNETTILLEGLRRKLESGIVLEDGRLDDVLVLAKARMDVLEGEAIVPHSHKGNLAIAFLGLGSELEGVAIDRNGGEDSVAFRLALSSTGIGFSEGSEDSVRRVGRRGVGKLVGPYFEGLGVFLLGCEDVDGLLSRWSRRDRGHDDYSSLLRLGIHIAERRLLLRRWWWQRRCGFVLDGSISEKEVGLPPSGAGLVEEELIAFESKDNRFVTKGGAVVHGSSAVTILGVIVGAAADELLDTS